MHDEDASPSRRGQVSLAPGRRRALRVGLSLASLFLGIHLLLPLLSGLRETAAALMQASWWLPLSLLALESASYLAYGELQLGVFRTAGERPRRGLVQRTAIIAAALGKTVPGANATSTAMVVGMLRSHGMSGATATAGIAASGIMSSLALALLLPVGALVALTAGDPGSVTLGVLAMAVATVTPALLLPWALRDPRRAGALAERGLRAVTPRRLRHRLRPEAFGAVVTAGAAAVAALMADRQALARAGGWAVTNWLLDYAVFLTLALTLGRGTPAAATLLVYVVGQFIAAVPLTPGGVGVVEATTTALLVAAGAPAGEATAVVLGWRLLSHWLPIVVGLVLLPTVTRSEQH